MMCPPCRYPTVADTCPCRTSPVSMAMSFPMLRVRRRFGGRFRVVSGEPSEDFAELTLRTSTHDPSGVMSPEDAARAVTSSAMYFAKASRESVSVSDMRRSPVRWRGDVAVTLIQRRFLDATPPLFHRLREERPWRRRKDTKGTRTLRFLGTETKRRVLSRYDLSTRLTPSRTDPHLPPHPLSTRR